MKKYNYLNLRGVPFVMLLLLTAFLCSCSRKITFNTSTAVPAAQGYVKLKTDDNGNHAVSIKIENLASPQRLRPPGEAYVVWIETRNSGVKNIGQLKSSSGLFSNSLEATLNTVTPFKPTRVFITAEERSDIQYPGAQTVLQTSQF